MDEAVAIWRDEVLPAGQGQPGYVGALLLRDDAAGKLVGIGVWQSKADADAWAATGPWRPGSALRARFEGLLAGEPTREEFAAAYVNAG
jgi:hypothetical protein